MKINIWYSFCFKVNIDNLGQNLGKKVKILILKGKICQQFGHSGQKSSKFGCRRSKSVKNLVLTSKF